MARPKGSKNKKSVAYPAEVYVARFDDTDSKSGMAVSEKLGDNFALDGLPGIYPKQVGVYTLKEVITVDIQTKEG